MVEQRFTTPTATPVRQSKLGRLGQLARQSSVDDGLTEEEQRERNALRPKRTQNLVTKHIGPPKRDWGSQLNRGSKPHFEPEVDRQTGEGLSLEEQRESRILRDGARAEFQNWKARRADSIDSFRLRRDAPRIRPASIHDEIWEHPANRRSQPRSDKDISWTHLSRHRQDKAVSGPGSLTSQSSPKISWGTPGTSYDQYAAGFQQGQDRVASSPSTSTIQSSPRDSRGTLNMSKDQYAAASQERQERAREGRYMPIQNRPGKDNLELDDYSWVVANSQTEPPLPVSEQRDDETEQASTSKIITEFERTELEEVPLSRFRSGRFAVGNETTSGTYDATPRHRRRSDEKRKETKYETLDEDEGEMKMRTRKEQKKQRQKEKTEREVAAPTPIELPSFISVANLADALKIRLERFMEKLEELGFEEIASDHVLSAENAGLIAMEYNFEPLIDRSQTEDLVAQPLADDRSLLVQRPPIVTIMGHVDHGKTTLLDYLRKSSVAASEHGGITQHIGAFSVRMASGKVVTFLDTPGHEAFLSMRQRGANVTDIVILVVAADDSVKPQTIEAIKHATSAQVPIIVAINKVDKDEANIDRVKQDLTRHGIEVEDYGGDIQAVEVSGKTGQGIETLEEAVVALAEILDKRAETDGPVEGWVLEATTKKAGRVATVLIRRGTLRAGNIIVAGTTWARVRTLRNEAGTAVREAGPGTPVEVDGWRDQPAAGDEILQAPNEQKATSVVSFREARIERTKAAQDMEAINEFRRLQMERREREKEATAAAEAAGNAGEVGDQSLAGDAVDLSKTANEAERKIELYFVIKADVSGSVEAVESFLSSIPLENQPVTISIIHRGVGPISESDVAHAAAAPAGSGFLISFNQSVPGQISYQAEQAGVRILDENIIYKVIDDVRAVVEDKLPPLITSRVTGEAETAQVFDINTGGRKTVKVAGCKVRNGSVGRGNKVRVWRGGVGVEGAMVYEGLFLSRFTSHFVTILMLTIRW